MFFHHMAPKIAKDFAREVALSTLERAFSSVLALVYFQTARFSAGIIALITLERLFSSVHALVYFHLTSSGARIGALITLVRLSS